MRQCDNLKVLMYEKMFEIRAFEQRVSQLRYDSEIVGAVHCCIGQEAISVGVCMALRESDYVMGNHRSHGHMLAKGACMDKVMAEIYGKESGTNGGRGGSLHICDSSIGMIGATGIVGSGLPVACGAAFASKYKKEDKVTVVFFGDGASNEGTFHECLNLAALWKLPVIFVLENNGVAVTTLNTTTTSSLELYKRAESYGIPGYRVNGQDVMEVYDITKKVTEYVRAGNGPVLIEAMTHRFDEHAAGKYYYRMRNTGYRDNEEVEKWKATSDPIVLVENNLLEEKLLTETQVVELKDKIIDKVDSAVKFAEMSDEPNAQTAYNYVYSDGGIV